MNHQNESHAQTALSNRLITGGGWAFTGRLGSILGTTAVTLILARLLSPRDLGGYFLAVSVATLAATAGQMGMGQAALRLVSKANAIGQSNRIAHILSLVFGFGAVGATAVAVMLADGPGKWVAARLFGSDVLLDVRLLVGLIAAVKVIERIVAEAFRGLHDIRRAVLFGGLLTNWVLAICFLAGLVVFSEVRLAQVLGTILIATLVVTGFGISKLVPRRGVRAFSDPSPSLKEVVDLAWPLYITALAYVLINNLDLWVVGALRGDESVALYGVALRMMLVVSIPITVVNAVVPPVISELTARDRLGELETVLRDSTTLAGLPALAAAGSILLAAEFIMRVAFGADFAVPEAASAARLLALGQLINVWAGSCGLTLMMSGHQKIMMRITLIGASFTLAATLFLGADYGIVGVAIGATLGQVLQNILMWWMVRRRVGISTHFSYARVPSLLAGIWKRGWEKS